MNSNALFGAVSLHSLIHTVQNYYSKVPSVKAFDYGRKENLLRYGSCDAPEYDLTKATVPVGRLYIILNLKVTLV